MKEEPANKIERREFLFKKVLIAVLGLAGAAFGWIFGDLWTASGRFSSARWVPVIPVDRLPPESVNPFPEHKLAILRKDAKVGAISLECTHLGCLVNTVDRGFFCPCHGSDFGPLGEVYSGPAQKPLPWHPLLNREGKIWVHLGEKLDQPQWLAMDSQHYPQSKEGPA